MNAVLLCLLCVCGAARAQEDNSTDSQTSSVIQARLEAFPTEDRQHFNVEIELGTPPQRLRVIFDTGSPGLNVFDHQYCNTTLLRTGCYNLNQSTSSAISSNQNGDGLGLSIDNEAVESLGSSLRVADEFSLVTSRRSLDAARVLLNSTRANTFLVRNCTYSTTGSSYPLRSWDKTQCFPYSDGVLGASAVEALPATLPEDVGPWFAILNHTSGQIDDRFGGVFGINFNYNSPSWVDVGGVSPEFAQSLVVPPFRGSLPTDPRNIFSFSIFQMAVCDVPLFGEALSRPAIVDTGATCLAIPETIFDTLFEWIPSHCAPIIADSNRSTRVCILPEDEDTSDSALPILSFALENAGRQLFLPLSSLLLDEVLELPTANGDSTVRGRRFCIVASQRSNFGRFTISFGSIVVERLYTYINLDDLRVGFANKEVVNSESIDVDAGCVPRTTCIGQSRFVLSSNSCQSPPCSEFAFFALDEESQTCVLSTSFTQAAAVVIGLIFLIEFSVNFLHAKLTDKIIKEVATL